MTAADAAPRPRPLLLGASSLVFVAMLSSFTPTPLYPVYQERWGTGPLWVSVAFAAYPLGVLTVLVFFGGLSDRWGRRRTLLLAAAVILVSVLTLATAATPAMVVAGRLLQGVATALTTGAAAAAMMELHPAGVQAGALLNTVSLSFGCALGPLVAATVAAHSGRPTVAPYLVVAALVALPGGLLLRTGDGPRPGPGVRPVRRIRVPARLLRPFLLAGGAVLLTNACMGIYGSFGSGIAAAVGWDGRQQAGGLVSLVFFATAVAQLAARSLSSGAAIVLGSLACAAGWALTALATQWGALPPALLGAVLIGAGAGLDLLGSAGLIGLISPPDARAEIYSAYLCVAFSALGGTVLLTGQALDRAPLGAVTWLVTAVVALLAGAVGYGVRRILGPAAGGGRG